MHSTLDIVLGERASESLPKGGWKTGRRFADFVVDGIPLSSIVQRKADVISMLGWGLASVQREVVERLLLQRSPDFPPNRYALYVCPECGDLSCGAISAVIERTGDVAVWRDFGYQNDYESGPPDRRHIEQLGEYRFDWNGYEATIRRGYGMGGFIPEVPAHPTPWWRKSLKSLFR